MVLAEAAPAATSLLLCGVLPLRTTADADAFARAAPGVADLFLQVHNQMRSIAIATLLGLMSGRLRSLTLLAPAWDVTALAVLCACLHLHQIGGACGLRERHRKNARPQPHGAACLTWQ